MPGDVRLFTPPRLARVNLAGNQIPCIPYNCFNGSALERLNIAGNHISDAQSIISLEDVKSLRDLKFADPDYAPNPIMNIPACEAFIVHLLPQLERVCDVCCAYRVLTPVAERTLGQRGGQAQCQRVRSTAQCAHQHATERHAPLAARVSTRMGILSPAT